MTVSSGDESFAWKAAFLVMLVFSLLAIGLRLFERAFFSPEFEVSLVYVPTAVLFAVWLSEALRLNGRKPREIFSKLMRNLKSRLRSSPSGEA